MASPYRSGAIVGPAGSSLPEGSTALTEEEYALFLEQLPAKIYEPVMILGEMLVIDSGDCLVEWGGEYAS